MHAQTRTHTIRVGRHVIAGRLLCFAVNSLFLLSKPCARSNQWVADFGQHKARFAFTLAPKLSVQQDAGTALLRLDPMTQTR